MTPPASGLVGLDEGAARILVVVDAAVPLAVHETHHNWQAFEVSRGPSAGA